MADEDRIARAARAARALCAADGSDPEEVVHLGTDEVEPNATGIGYRRTVRGPAWTTYVSEARRFIAAAKALGLME